ncbi:MAG: ribosome silencing factor [Candidatus Omnitrophica bacterium]|nr:ribosome silencing factor [Candidatus Omnitrophota bacterium]
MAKAASDKKGRRIVTIDMRKMQGVCDYFVITSGTSSTHIQAISDNIVREIEAIGGRLRHIEGDKYASWILVDFGDVVGHVFLEDARKFYNLEKLWRAAPKSVFKEIRRRARGKVSARRVKARKKPARKALRKKSGR